METSETIETTHNDHIQLCGFRIGKGFYAIPVLEVQEVVKPQPLSKVPMAPSYIDGLINLRGQIVTSINLRKLFKLQGEGTEEFMNVIVRSGDSLYSLVVDEILDVMNIEKNTFADTPDTLDQEIRQYIDGVYKLKDKLLILLSLEKLLKIDE